MCPAVKKKYLKDIDDLPIAHYMSGPSCYVPDAKFIIGPVARYKGLHTVTGCCGGGVAAGGGMGRLAAELILGETPFVNPELFSPERFGEVDPFLLNSSSAVPTHVPIKKEDKTGCVFLVNSILR